MQWRVLGVGLAMLAGCGSDTGEATDTAADTQVAETSAGDATATAETSDDATTATDSAQPSETSDDTSEETSVAPETSDDTSAETVADTEPETTETASETVDPTEVTAEVTAPRCGDENVDQGEDCDPPDELTCSKTCQTIVGSCSDASDNDGDTQADCADPDCAEDPFCAVVGTRLVSGEGLVLEDVAEDGLYLAYTDASHTLFTVPLAGGAPVQIATGVDKARFKGKFLMVYQGIDASGKIAATMRVVPEGTSAASLTTQLVKLNTVIASPDGNHYLFERKPDDQSTTDDVYLDGNLIFAAATTAREAFSPASNYLVASDFYKDPGSGTKMNVVRAWPLDGGPPTTLVASDAASRFSITPNGQSVVVGFNDSGPAADLTLVPMTGGNGTLLVEGGRDQNFDVMEDGATLVFMDVANEGLSKIGLNGQGLATLVPSGVASLDGTSKDLVVYATAVDGGTGLATLRAIKKDGTHDMALGDLALNEGFSPGAAYFTYRDQLGASDGNLQVLAVATMTRTQFATGVVKSSVADDMRLVYLDTGGLLRTAALATAAKATLEDHVTFFRLVSDGVGVLTKSRVAFVVGVGAPGIYVTAF